MHESNEFSALTACGECCTGCKKKLAGDCPGCIEADGYVPEWAGSGRCRIHACAKDHGVTFCGDCLDFPCAALPAMMPWKKDVIEQLRALAQRYEQGGRGACPTGGTSASER